MTRMADELEGLFLQLNNLIPLKKASLHSKKNPYETIYWTLVKVRSNQSVSDEKIKDILSAVVEAGQCDPISNPEKSNQKIQILQCMSEELKLDADKSDLHGDILVGLSLALAALAMVLFISGLLVLSASAPPFSIFILPAVVLALVIISAGSFATGCAYFKDPARSKLELSNNLSFFSSSAKADDDLTIASANEQYSSEYHQI